MRLFSKIFLLFLAAAVSSPWPIMAQRSVPVPGVLVDVDGKEVDISGASYEVTERVDGHTISIRGYGHRITLTGECESLIVAGTNNTVILEKVGSIDVSGTSNVVQYQSGIGGKDPEISRFGVSCRVEKIGGEKNGKENGFERLFDGETLDGWKGADGYWTVKDGAITGRTSSENPIDENTFLIWDGGELDNFKLRLKFRISDGNSGVQFRSKDLGDYRVAGYQADIDSKNDYTGILYDERGRGILCSRFKKTAISKDGNKRTFDDEAGDDTAFRETFEDAAWNEYLIEVKGDRIRQTVNGVVTAEVIDQEKSKSSRKGILALQLHTGPPMTVQFKDIQLKKLSD